MDADSRKKHTSILFQPQMGPAKEAKRFGELQVGWIVIFSPKILVGQ